MRRVCLFLLWMMWWLPAPRARAETYAVERPIEDEADLLALGDEGALPEEDVEALRELLRTGVDPLTASREALYALPGFTWAQVDALIAWRETRAGDFTGEDLVEAGVLTGAQLDRVRAFLGGRTRGAPDVSGRVRLLSAYGTADAWVPPVLLQARVRGPWGLHAGVTASLTRRRLEVVHYDSRRRALVAGPPGVTVRLPKFHLRWEGARASVLVGAYRLGFGQRLTLDTTGRPAPDGFIPDEDFTPPGAPERRCMVSGAGACGAEELGRITPDFGWTEGFRGGVGTVHGRVEDVTLSFTGFGSYQSRGLSQYELFDRTRCASSRGCPAPEVFALLPGSRGTARFVSRTLPGVFHELAGGGHAAVGFSPRARLGVTAWSAGPVWALEGMAPDFRAQARYPGGGGYGAVGLDAAWGTGPVDLFLEGTRSFAAAGGGFGALQRLVLGDRARQLEGSLRYYGRGFENPHGRPLASPDESGGLRASNEMGTRLRYLHRTEDEAWRWVGQVDLWTQPGGPPRFVHVTGALRVEALNVPLLQPSVWVEHHNKDLGRNGPGLCFEGTEGELPGGAPAPCPGERYGVGGRVKFEPIEALSLAAQYQHTWMGSPQHPEGRRRDGRALLEGILRPLPSLRLHGRMSWRDEDLADDTRLAQTLRTSLAGAWALASGSGIRARYEFVLAPPEPPQHLFRLELEGVLP